MKAQFPGQLWNGTSRTDTNTVDDKAPDYATHDQVIAEIIATQEIVATHIGLVEPLQNPGVARSLLMVDDDGIGFRYRKLKAGSNVSISYSDTEITITATGGGGGGDDTFYLFVDGSKPLTDNWDVGAFQLKNLADPTEAQDATTRTWVSEALSGSQNFTVALLQNYTNDAIAGLESVYAPLSHTHTISQITDLQTTLDGKAAVSHSHTIADTTGLQDALDGKAALSHTHTIADTTGLQAALDGKAASSHTHTIANTTGLQAALDGKAASSHTHAISDITALQAALDAKVTAGLHKCVLTRTTNQTVPVSTSTKIAFGTNPINVGGMADVANSQVVIQRTGYYLVYGAGYFTLGVNNIQLDIRANSASIGAIVHTDAADSFFFVTLVRLVSLTAGDVVDMVMQHNNSASASRDTVIGGRSATLGVIELA